MSRRIATILQPVFDEFVIEAYTSAFDADPMQTFNPLAVKTVLFECGAAEIEALGCLLFACEVKHDNC